MKSEEIERQIEQLTKVKVEDLDEDALELFNFVMKKLDYIDEIEKELEKKDKIIVEMAESIAESVEILGEYCEEGKIKSCTREYEECAECIIKYFERKVENGN